MNPLDNVRVLDLTENLAGPYCTMVLADMGAEVIKLEKPNGGDSSRLMGPISFGSVNRNKKSITLDYKTPEGRTKFFELVKGVDVLVESYRATTMLRLGFGWGVLHTLNPRLIYASLSGYGDAYPDKGGYDLIAQGMGGIMHVTGEADGPPTSVGLPICDLGTGMWAVSGILAALYKRTTTGQGQHITCSLLETAVGYSSWTGASYLHNGIEPKRTGSTHRQDSPYQRFRTLDGYIMIAAHKPQFLARCLEALGIDVNEPGTFKIRGEMDKILRGHPTAHWIDILDKAGIPCGPVNTYQEMWHDPQIRTMINMVKGETHVRIPLQMSDSSMPVRSSAPLLGQHNQEILGDENPKTTDAA